jgi:hypothetical protein
MINQYLTFTTDPSIRAALRSGFANACRDDPEAVVIEELGLNHGAVRVDMAVVNRVIHGYELKSDRDTLNRLPEQAKIYNSVLDRITLVVAKNHLCNAIKLVPDWWGIILAKPSANDDRVSLVTLRDAEENPEKQKVAIASLLWRDEALQLLEEVGEAKGVRSKPRRFLYERLASVLDDVSLRAKVRKCLLTRVGWRSAIPRTSSGG